MSIISRYLYWCKTRQGQIFGTTICVGLNFGVFCALYLPHTLFLNRLKNLVQLNERRKPVEMPDQLTNIVNEVMDDLKFEEYERKNIKPFIVCRFKPFQAGLLNASNGGIIGIPWHFTYDDIIDVKIPQISLYKSPIDTSRMETEELAESFVLSRDAKKFAIAREICSLRDSNCMIDSIIASTIFFASFSFSQGVKHKFNLYAKPLWTRVFLYVTSAFSGAVLYFYQKDYFAKEIEKNIDAELAKININYLKGGLEYYSKVLEANIAQRKLLDEFGEKTYDVDGNIAYFLRQKSTPYTQRKLFFETLLNELSNLE